MYLKESKLTLTRKVYITEEAYLELRRLKTDSNMSMAKIVCNLILNKKEPVDTTS